MEDMEMEKSEDAGELQVALTGPDFADLCAGLSFNTAVSDGSEVVIFGEEFSDEEVKRLAEGSSAFYDAYGLDYTVTAPEAADCFHRHPEEGELNLRPGTLRWALARGLAKEAATEEGKPLPAPHVPRPFQASDGNEKDCPYCGSSLQGPRIPEEYVRAGNYGALDPEVAHYYSRLVGVEEDDVIAAWMCPDCGATWPSEGAPWSAAMDAAYEESLPKPSTQPRERQSPLAG